MVDVGVVEVVEEAVGSASDGTYLMILSFTNGENPE